MKVPVVYIELANSSRSYLAGQVIQGRVVVQNDKPLKVKEVTVLLEGTGRVSWSETESYTVHETRTVNGRTESHPVSRTRTVTYSSSETYVSQKISLAGDGHNLMELAVGMLIYPFQFVLPTNVPSSFTSRTGLISYFLEAELRRPMLKPNKRMALPITVNGIYDLNIEFGASQPQQLQKVKGSNFCACRKGQLGFVLKLPMRSGFVPGEILHFSSEVTNSSNKKIKGMKAILYQVAKFHAQGHTKTETKTIVELKGPAVDVGDHEMWIPNSMAIPPLPPTRLGGSTHIIDVQYHLHFEMKISGLSLSLTGDIPVMIGTIPLRSTFDELRNAPQMPMPQLQPPQWAMATPQPGPSMGFNLPTAGTSKTHEIDELDSLGVQQEKFPPPQPYAFPSAPVLTDYPDLPPPSYAEAVSTEAFTWNTGDSSSGYANTTNVIENEADTPSAPPMGTEHKCEARGGRRRRFHDTTGGGWLFRLPGETTQPPTPPPPIPADYSGTFLGMSHPALTGYQQYENQYNTGYDQGNVGQNNYVVQQPYESYGGENYYAVQQPSGTYVGPNNYQVQQPSASYVGPNNYQVQQPSASYVGPNNYQVQQPSASYVGPNNYQVQQPSASYVGPNNYQVQQPSASYGGKREVVVADTFQQQPYGSYFDDGYVSAYASKKDFPKYGIEPSANVQKQTYNYYAPPPPPPPARPPPEPAKKDPYSSHIFENPPSEIKTDYRWMDKTNNNDENRGNSILQQTTHTLKIQILSLFVLIQLLVL